MQAITAIKTQPSFHYKDVLPNRLFYLRNPPTNNTKANINFLPLLKSGLSIRSGSVLLTIQQATGTF